MNQPLLLDVGPLSCGCTDRVLGALSKALSGEDGDAADIWAQHESPFVRALIELFSKRGLLRLQKVQDELNAWLSGDRYAQRPIDLIARPELHGLRLEPHELSLAKIYLENIPPAEFAADDWALLVDYLVSRYMPFDALQTEAQWLAVRATYMGKVQSQVRKLPFKAAEALVAALPSTVAEAKAVFHPQTPVQAVLDYGFARCADNVQGIGEDTRHRLKRVILDHEEQRMLGAHPPQQELKQRLFDEFAVLNRDWRKIALTETAEMQGGGLIASLKPGSRVQRMEYYKGVCSFCRSINGSIFTVVSPDKPNKNGLLEVWVGKNNLGRSGAKRKRTDDGMVERGEDERWQVTAGPIHPHCRGFWDKLPDAEPTDDPDFAAWLNDHFAKHRKIPLAGDPG